MLRPAVFAAHRRADPGARTRNAEGTNAVVRSLLPPRVRQRTPRASQPMPDLSRAVQRRAPGSVARNGSRRLVRRGGRGRRRAALALGGSRSPEGADTMRLARHRAAAPEDVAQVGHQRRRLRGEERARQPRRAHRVRHETLPQTHGARTAASSVHSEGAQRVVRVLGRGRQRRARKGGGCSRVDKNLRAGSGHAVAAEHSGDRRRGVVRVRPGRERGGGQAGISDAGRARGHDSRIRRY